MPGTQCRYQIQATSGTTDLRIGLLWEGFPNNHSDVNIDLILKQYVSHMRYLHTHHNIILLFWYQQKKHCFLAFVDQGSRNNVSTLPRASVILMSVFKIIFPENIWVWLHIRTKSFHFISFIVQQKSYIYLQISPQLLILTLILVRMPTIIIIRFFT